jgi:hypothetical protein
LEGRPLDHPDLHPISGAPGFQQLLADLTAGAVKGGK